MDDFPVATSKQFAAAFGRMLSQQLTAGGDRRELIKDCAHVLAVFSIADVTQSEAQINLLALADGMAEGTDSFNSFMKRALVSDGEGAG